MVERLWGLNNPSVSTGDVLIGVILFEEDVIQSDISLLMLYLGDIVEKLEQRNDVCGDFYSCGYSE